MLQELFDMFECTAKRRNQLHVVQTVLLHQLFLREVDKVLRNQTVLVADWNEGLSFSRIQQFIHASVRSPDLLLCGLGGGCMLREGRCWSCRWRLWSCRCLWRSRFSVARAAIGFKRLLSTHKFFDRLIARTTQLTSNTHLKRET